MRRDSLKRAAAFLASVALGAAADANAMRCGNKLISKGDAAAKILRYCGPPETSRSELAPRIVYPHGRSLYGVTQEVRVEEWTYNFGPSKLMRVVILEDGIVTDIRQLGYGHKR
jgi:hypothetical protein